MSDEIHSCSYYCDRPACIKEQRDKMRDAMAIDDVKMPDTFVCEIRYPFGDFETVKYHGTNALADYRDHVHPDAYVRELVYKKDAIEYADAKCAELRRRVAELEADARRLDYLDSCNLPMRIGWDISKAPYGNVKVSSVIFLGSDPVTIRAAIDDAIGAEGGEQ